MNSEQEKQVIEATQALKLRDVQLHDCRFERPTSVTAEQTNNARQENMRGVRFVIGDAEIENRSVKILQVLVNLGIRVVADVSEPEPPVYFVIEAEFMVEYEITGNLDEQAVVTFANFNGVHNAWPFWRQHVYDIVQRARLPHLDIALYGGVKS